jgi:hypothetical protein
MSAGRAGILATAVLPALSASYDESRALEYVKFAGAAYCSQSALESWSCGSKCSAVVSDVTVCNGNHVRAFVGKWEDKCLVSFEGTSDITSAIKDLEFLHSAVPWNGCEGCKVHGGFLDEYNSVRGGVKAVLAGTGCPVGSEIRTTGHSLGAAMNSLAMMDLTDAGWIIEESYDFGKPRTGNSEFAAAHNKLLGNRTFRVTHGRDPVPQVPPDQLVVDWHFEHVEPEVYYPGTVAEGHIQCNDVESSAKDCVEQYWNLAIDILHLNDHLTYMEAQTSIFGCENGGTTTQEPTTVAPVDPTTLEPTISPVDPTTPGPTTAPVEPAQCEVFPNHEVDGDDLGDAGITGSADDCCAKCSAQTECSGWTWAHEGGECQLKGNIGEPRPTSLRMTTGKSTSTTPETTTTTSSFTASTSSMLSTLTTQEPTSVAPTTPTPESTTTPAAETTTSPVGPTPSPNSCRACMTICAPCKECTEGPDGSFAFGSCEKCWHCWDWDDDELEDDDDNMDKDCDALHKDHGWSDDEVRCLTKDHEDCRACWAELGEMSFFV